jgi:predicted permease
VAQVALSTLLVAGAGLFVRSLLNLQQLGPGFDTANVVTFSVDPSLGGYSQPAIRQLFARLEEALAAEPGVTAVALADQPVLTGNSSQRTVKVQGYDAQQGEDMNPWTLEVGPRFFETLGIPVRQGRAFTARDVDGAPPVAVVNESFARYFFGDENPIGRRFGFSAEGDAGRMEIVGVVKDTAYSQVRPGENGPDDAGFRRPLGGMPRVVYTPYQQSASLAEVTLYVRTTDAATATVAGRVREVVRQVDRGLPLQQLTTLAATVNRSLGVERMLAWLSLLFGALATTLAAIGLDGVMHYTVARRTREIGIRIALGAARGDVLGLVLRDVGRLTAAGILLGLPGAYLVGRAAANQLFGLTPLDPVSLTAAATLLAAVGAGAGYLPARRAAATNPTTALRSE